MTDDSGRTLPYKLAHAELEHFAGRRILHLQADRPRDESSNTGLKAVFEIRWK